MSFKSLPKHWVTTTLESLTTDISYGYTASSSCEPVGPKMLRITDIQDNDVNWANVPYCQIENDKKEKYLLKKNDLVFARTGATVGKSYLIRNEPPEAVYASYLIRVRTASEELISILAHFFNSNQYWEQITEFSSGIGQPNVNGTKLKSLNVPLPPLAEQKDIADKLDTLLAQVEASKTRLERIPDILKRFRQSVLAAAVSGKLTEEWRKESTSSNLSELMESIETERIKLKKQKTLKKSFGSEHIPRPLFDGIPRGWSWVVFEQIAKNNNYALKAGPFGSALKKSDCVSKGYKVYGQEQVIAGDEKLDTYFINNEKFDQLKSCEVVSGDILISLVGTIGKTLILSEKAKQGIINPRLVKISLNEQISRSYIQAYLDSIIAHDFFKSFSHGGTMEILNLSILKELPIPLPPIEEQTEIVRRVEELFAFADNIEQKTMAVLERVNNLTQSILAKAFRGELTAEWRAQNPDLISGDNSAEALLEKIKAEREALAAQMKSKKRAKSNKKATQ